MALLTADCKLNFFLQHNNKSAKLQNPEVMTELKTMKENKQE